MSKNKIILVLSICAVLFSTLACFLIYRYMAPSRGTIYMFNAPYKAGEQVRAEMLSPVQVDAKMILAGKKTDITEQFVTPSVYQSIVKSGDSLRMDVAEGMPLMTSMLSVAGGSSVEMFLKSDAIAVTIAVDPFSGVTNDLKEGAKVNIYANLDAQTKLIQQNKRVLEVYKDDGEIIGVAIEEDIQESLELVYAANYGKIYLGLVDGSGYQAVEGADPVYNPYMQDSKIHDFDSSLISDMDEIENHSNTIPEDTEETKEENIISIPDGKEKE